MGASADCVTGLSPALARTKGGPKMRPSLTQNLLRQAFTVGFVSLRLLHE